MTRIDLENAYHIAGEIEDIERQLEELKGKKDTWAVDCVKDYRSGYAKPLTIAGFGYSESTYKKRQELLIRLGKQRFKLIIKKTKIEEELEKIGEAIVRRIIRLRYFDRLSWDAVALVIDGSKTGDAMRKRLDKFLEENSAA